MTTNFVHWYLLQDAHENAPESPGVFQVRIPEGLITYPSGKSAMVQYGLAQNLCTELSELAAAHADVKFLCRHQHTNNPSVLLEFVLAQFQKRFGVAPAWPRLEGLSGV